VVRGAFLSETNSKENRTTEKSLVPSDTMPTPSKDLNLTWPRRISQKYSPLNKLMISSLF